MTNRIDDAMIEVVGKLNVITEHLRKNNFEESSNQISKNVHEIVSVFTEAVVKFGEDEMFMDNVASRSSSQDSTEYGNGGNFRNGNGRDIQLEYRKVFEKARQTNGNDNDNAGAIGSYRQGKSWAKVASTSDGNGNGNGAPAPSQPWRMALAERQRRQHQNAVITSARAMVPVGTIQPIETDEERAGSIIISGKFMPGSLNHLTSKIREGPLFSVDISYTDDLAEIIFERASHALAFVESDSQLTKKLGHGRFGTGYKVIFTELLEWSNELQQMENRPKERRRLTFARAAFLGQELSLKTFQAEVVEAAGPENVDFIWAFNSGNVTTVFKSVAVARDVHKIFSEKASQGGPYKGVQITFSTDPCEKQLVLGSQGGVPAGHFHAAQKFGGGGAFRRK